MQCTWDSTVWLSREASEVHDHSAGSASDHCSRKACNKQASTLDGTLAEAQKEFEAEAEADD